jgi:hypothetical protein
MAPRSTHFLDVSSAEQRFAQTVQSFIGSYDPRVQGTVARVAACWAKEWVNLASPTLFPPTGVGLSEMEREVYCARWRTYYQEHREHICQRRRERRRGIQ